MDNHLHIPFMDKEALLLKKFNNRDSRAFSRVYILFYKELHMYASYIYRDTNENPEDVIQDIFSRLWENKVIFDTLIKIKAFIYVSIKNAYKNYLKHLGYQNRYVNEIDSQSAYDIIECEVFTTLEETLQLLPKDCGTILKMYIEGYKPEEIAETLGYKVRTVYNKKQMALTILKEKLPNDMILLLMTINSLINVSST